MRVLVTGGRAFADPEDLFSALTLINTFRPITQIIHGGAEGADTYAGEWGERWHVRVTNMKADWLGLEGKRSGNRRNQMMLDLGRPHLCVSAPGGSGTWDMRDKVRRAGVPIIRIWHPEDLMPGLNAARILEVGEALAEARTRQAHLLQG